MSKFRDGGREGGKEDTHTPTHTWLFRLVPKVGSLMGIRIFSLFEARTKLFNPLSTVPTSAAVNSANS